MVIYILRTGLHSPIQRFFFKQLGPFIQPFPAKMGLLETKRRHSLTRSNLEYNGEKKEIRSTENGKQIVPSCGQEKIMK